MSSDSEAVGHTRQQRQIVASTGRTLGDMEMLDQEARDDAARALSRMDAHEVLCTERWNQGRIATAMLQKSVDGLVANSLDRLPAGIIAGLTALVGFLAERAFHL